MAGGWPVTTVSSYESLSLPAAAKARLAIARLVGKRLLTAPRDELNPAWASVRPRDRAENLRDLGVGAHSRAMLPILSGRPSPAVQWPLRGAQRPTWRPLSRCLLREAPRGNLWVILGSGAYFGLSCHPAPACPEVRLELGFGDSGHALPT